MTRSTNRTFTHAPQKRRERTLDNRQGHNEHGWVDVSFPDGPRLSQYRDWNTSSSAASCCRHGNQDSATFFEQKCTGQKNPCNHHRQNDAMHTSVNVRLPKARCQTQARDKTQLHSPCPSGPTDEECYLTSQSHRVATRMMGEHKAACVTLFWCHHHHAVKTQIQRLARFSSITEHPETLPLTHNETWRGHYSMLKPPHISDPLTAQSTDARSNSWCKPSRDADTQLSQTWSTFSLFSERFCTWLGSSGALCGMRTFSLEGPILALG